MQFCPKKDILVISPPLAFLLLSWERAGCTGELPGSRSNIQSTILIPFPMRMWLRDSRESLSSYSFPVWGSGNLPPVCASVPSQWLQMLRGTGGKEEGLQ